MSRKRADKHPRRKARKRRTESAQSGVPGVQPDEMDLMVDIDRALAEPSPLGLLALTSTLLAVADPRRRSPFDPNDEPGVSMETLVGSFLDVDLAQTTAVLHVIATLTGDQLMAARIRRQLASRRHALPAWLVGLPRAQISRVEQMTHVLGDGDNIYLEVQLPDGGTLTAVVYIDHNIGRVVKDAFVVDAALRDIYQLIGSEIDEDTVVSALDPADARARITEAIDWGVRTFPPLETDTWPQCRALVEWLVGMLPPGGRGYRPTSWSEERLHDLAEEFFSSPHGAPLDSEDSRSLLDSLLWYANDYGKCDPLRWSAVSVEILLLDWIPRKLIANASYLSAVPSLLRALIRYSHERLGIRPSHTRETLDAVDEHESEYMSIIRAPRLQGPAALLAQMGLDLPSSGGGVLGLPSIDDHMLARLAAEVGGESALDILDQVPLPDEPFDWAGVPDDVQPRVREVLDLVDGACAAFFDTEIRTAARRLLAAAATRDPAVFRRAGASHTAAAAVCWSVGKANNAVGPWGDVAVQDLMTHFGVKGSVSQRATTLLKAAGIQPGYGEIVLGSPRYLTSRRRMEIIERRDHYRARKATGER